MKKNRILILLLLAALLALTACGDAKEEVTPAPAEATTAAPTEAPTPEPTEAPTEAPTPEPTEEPTPEPTAEPTAAPTAEPTAEPTAAPTAEPTLEPTEAPEAQTIGGADGATAILVADEATPDEATPGEADDPVIATAYDGALTLRASEVRDEYDVSLQSAIDYYAQYGYTMDEYDEELQASVAQETVQLQMSQLVAQRHSDELGYVLTDEHAAELAQQAEDMIASVRDYYEGYLSYFGYEGDELDAIVEEQLQAGGYTYDELYESLLLNDRLDFLYDIATKDVSVSDEDVKTYFDAKVAEAQERYADIDEFINDYLSGAELLVTPEGLRTVNCIYIAPVEGEATPGEAAEATADEATADEATADEAAADEATADEATADEAAADEATADEATADEATADEAAADEATPDEADPAALSGYAKAAAVRAQLDAGMSFEDAMIAYNEDGATEEQLAAGYPVAEATALYSDAFKDAALALAAPGDVSDVVCAEEGYFILRYKEDLTPATAALEERLETETAEALSSKQNETFSAYVDQMLEDAGIVVGDLTALYHVFEPDRVEAEIAYATVSAGTQLTDMPAGDAVAALHAGVALDVLGRIGMDGENYAFVAVMGTQIKGYVDASALTDLAEADALATDNAALCEAETALPDKLPTFTIVMNDGSLIYGELYPDVAPETVGNFVSLAGSGFYDGLTFHRVVPGFVIQGGDPNGDGTGGPGYAIRGEFESNGVANDLSHMRGVLSMARSSSPDSAGSQFFIMHADNDYLDGDYAAFGLVLGGIETVDVIASTPTDGNDRPLTEQTMRAVYVETYGHSYAFTKLDD